MGFTSLFCLAGSFGFFISRYFFLTVLNLHFSITGLLVPVIRLASKASLTSSFSPMHAFGDL